MLKMIKSWWNAFENRTFEQRVKAIRLIAAISFSICGASMLLIRYGFIIADQTLLLTSFIILMSGLLFVFSLLAIANLYLIKYLDPKLKKLINEPK